MSGVTRKWLYVFFAGVLVSFLAAAEALAIPQDFDGDGDVDIDDINILVAARNTPASGVDDPRDLDGDGQITVMDARRLVLLCTLPRCERPPTPANRQPVADAGPDQPVDILVGDVVLLDGSASSDPDGDALTYSWVLMTAPTDSSAQLSDPGVADPTFVADKSGIYTVRLTVKDGAIESAADDVSVTVVIPRPTVSIATPENQSVVAASPVTVAGTVDDPSATITIAGMATQNENGGYSADVTLAEGENTVTVVASNSTGDGSASVDVILRTLRGPGPAMTITAPEPGFTAGIAHLAVPSDHNVPVAVRGTITTPNGSAAVMVNGVVATITALPRNPLFDFVCLFFPSSPICDQRYSFSAEIQLSKGQQTIIAEGRDTVGTSIVSVNGVADYCVIGEAEPGVLAERGDGQNNRCHEIDGCNRNKLGGVGSTDTLSLRNQPMPNSLHHRVTVEFGSGYIPATDARNDFFVHGQEPGDALGCNFHDTCYQTCVPPGGDRDAAFKACNLQQFEGHKAMCRKAYPSCPYTGLEALIGCPAWQLEKIDCFAIAGIYRTGVGVGGGSQYDVRQNDYCAAP